METIEVLGDLNSRIAFQKKWRQITSFSYFTGATLSVIAAATEEQGLFRVACGDLRVPPGASGDFVRDQCGMDRCLNR